MQKLLIPVVLAAACTATLHAQQWPTWRGPGVVGRLGRARPAGRVERHQGHRLEGVRARPRDLVADRVERRGHPDLTGGHRRGSPGAAARAGRQSRRGRRTGAGAGRRRLRQGVLPGHRARPRDRPARRGSSSSPPKARCRSSTRSTTSPRPARSPTANAIYAWFGTGQVAAIDMSGKLVWKKHLGAEYGPFEINWGHGSSPAVHDGVLLLLCYHERASYLLALDARTGAVQVEGRCAPGRDVLQHAARRRGGRPDAKSIVNSSEGMSGARPGHRPAALAHRRDQSLSGADAAPSRRRDLRQPRLPQQPVHGNPAGRQR